MNFIFIFILSSDPNLLRKKLVKQKIKNDGPINVLNRNKKNIKISSCKDHSFYSSKNRSTAT